jgi:hypothetical protein
VLETLYSKKIVDISRREASAASLSQVMNEAFAESLCPFKDYESSLAAFARAVYSLRLQNGRCQAGGFPGGCGLYDPAGLYAVPRAARLHYAGVDITYTNQAATGNDAPDNLPLVQPKEALPAPAIRSSFGMDFVEVVLDQPKDDLPLTLEFSIPSGSLARFSVQILPLREVDDMDKALLTIEELSIVSFVVDGAADQMILNIPLQKIDRLALVIVRLDPEEEADPVGEYQILLHH